MDLWLCEIAVKGAHWVWRQKFAEKKTVSLPENCIELTGCHGHLLIQTYLVGQFVK